MIFFSITLYPINTVFTGPNGAAFGLIGVENRYERRQDKAKSDEKAECITNKEAC